MRLQPHIFFMPDGSRREIGVHPSDAPGLTDDLGAMIYAHADEADEVASALWGRRQCERCIDTLDAFLDTLDRPPHRLPRRMG